MSSFWRMPLSVAKMYVDFKYLIYFDLIIYTYIFDLYIYEQKKIKLI